MSEHHHHDHKGHHQNEGPQKSSYKPVHHDWRFYAAGLLIFVALLAYLLSGDLSWRPAVQTVPAVSPR